MQAFAIADRGSHAGAHVCTNARSDVRSHSRTNVDAHVGSNDAPDSGCYSVALRVADALSHAIAESEVRERDAPSRRGVTRAVREGVVYEGSECFALSPTPAPTPSPTLAPSSVPTAAPTSR
jgi:hypothetical protein